MLSEHPAQPFACHVWQIKITRGGLLSIGIAAGNVVLLLKEKEKKKRGHKKKEQPCWLLQHCANFTFIWHGCENRGSVYLMLHHPPHRKIGKDRVRLIYQFSSCSFSDNCSDTRALPPWAALAGGREHLGVLLSGTKSEGLSNLASGSYVQEQYPPRNPELWGQRLFMGKWQNAYGLVLEIFQQENWLRESYRLFIQKEMECKITAQVKKQAKG